MAVDTSFIDKETDSGFLREYSKLLYRDLLAAKEELAVLRAAKEKSEQFVLDLTASYSVLRSDYFGRGREKLTYKFEDRPREKAESNVLLHAQSLVPEPSEADSAGLVKEQRRHTMSEAELDAELGLREPGLGAGFKASWQEMASFVECSREVTVIQRKFVEIIHERQKYKTTVVLPTGEEKDVIIAAPGPEKLLPGCTYGIELAVQVACDKYLMHLPLERQRRAMQGHGLKNVSVKTLWNLCWAVGEHLVPIAKQIRQDVLGAKLCVHADETPWPVQGKDSDGYMWSISNMAGSYYAFEPTRSGKVIEEMLNGYAGSVMSDGFAGYNRLRANSQIRLSNCWAHVRRKFFEIEEQSPGGPARRVVELLDELFRVERGIKSFAELAVARRDKSTPLVAEIRSCLETELVRHHRESQMKKAIAYTLKLWPGLTLFLKDTSIPLSNNDAERTLRHAVVGRKNYYGSKTIDGADLAATLFTVIESCKRVELDPNAFIEMAVRASVRGESPLTPLAYAGAIRGADPANKKN